MRVLLDTCTFLWLISDDPKLSDKARSLFENPENEVFLSSVSFWEINVKYQIGKLPLPESPKTYIPKQRGITASRVYRLARLILVIY